MNKLLWLCLKIGTAIIGTQNTDPPTDTPTDQSAGKWIPTDKQQPEYYKSVVIFTVDKETLYNWARVTDGKEDYYIHPTDEKTFTPNQVTHWMDLGSPI